MAKNKGSRIVITLECAKEEKSKSKGVFRYTTQKNRRNTPERIELKKFCPHSNCHKIFKEIK
jgi:large subunit ribosomal protein L33